MAWFRIIYNHLTKLNFLTGVWNSWQLQNRNCWSMKCMKLNKIGQKILFTNVYYLGILLTTERYSTRLKNLATFCRILSDTTKVSVHFHSKFIQNEWRVGLRLKIGHFWVQNVCLLHFVRYRTCQLTKSSAKFYKNVKVKKKNFNAPNFDFISISYSTISYENNIYFILILQLITINFFTITPYKNKLERFSLEGIFSLV